MHNLRGHREDRNDSENQPDWRAKYNLDSIGRDWIENIHIIVQTLSIGYFKRPCLIHLQNYDSYERLRKKWDILKQKYAKQENAL